MGSESSSNSKLPQRRGALSYCVRQGRSVQDFVYLLEGATALHHRRGPGIRLASLIENNLETYCPSCDSYLVSNWVSGFFGMDVMVSSAVLWVLVYVEGRRSAVKHLWAPIIANLAIGVSLGLPLFLYLRETRLERSA